MNQGESQFKIDLQLFGEDAGEATADANADAPAEEAAPSQTDSESAGGKTSISEMSDDEQLAFIKKNFVDDEKKDEQEVQAEPPKEQLKEEQQTQEPTFEIVYNGEKKQVKQSEIIALAQQGMDYTKKMQSLADQRRQVEAQLAQMQQVKQAPQQQATKPGERIKQDYSQAVAIVEKELGLQPGEFNMFDPMHTFALNNLIVRANMSAGKQMDERQAVANEVQVFQQEIAADPMTDEISNSFEQYILKRGLASREDGKKAQEVALSLARFNAGQATLRDCKILKEHWGYVKGELSKAKNPPPAKPAVSPPKTESPGVGRYSKEKPVVNIGKVRDLSRDPDRQMAYLKAAGIFD